jgi:lysophospholipase L1-like esterase
MRRALPLLALALAACGGGGDVPLEQPQAESCSVSILLNGDSTAWGYAPGGGGARAAVYPERALQAAMDARFGSGVVTVRTGAVSGSTSAGALEQPRDADLVLYNSGINDVAYGVPVDVYRANLRLLASPGAVFVTPTPVWAQPGYDGVMREVATDAGVPLIEARAWAESVQWWTYAVDGVHPTSDGYEAIALEVLMPALAPMVVERCAP